MIACEKFLTPRLIDLFSPLLVGLFSLFFAAQSLLWEIETDVVRPGTKEPTKGRAGGLLPDDLSVNSGSSKEAPGRTGQENLVG